MTEESIKDKIAKLMALANNEGAAPNEAETALRQAEKLMRKHGIELAEIQERTGQRPIYNWTNGMVAVGWPKPVDGNPPWFNWIAAAIGRFTDTKVTIQLRTKAHGTCAKFMGDETDVEYAVWLGNHIRTQIRIAANSYDAPGRSGDERWANREEFRHSMAKRICARMELLRKERTEAFRSAGTALVVINDKIAQRDQMFGVQKYKEGRQKGHIRGGADAFFAGQSAGDKVNFHRPVDKSKDSGRLT